MGRVARLTSRQTCAKFLKDSPQETGRRLVHEHLGLAGHRHHLQRAACQARSVGEDAGYYLPHGLDGVLIGVLLVWLIASAIFTPGSAGSFTVMSGCQKCCYPRTVRQNRRSSRSTGTHPGYGATSQSHVGSDRPAADLDQVPCSFSLVRVSGGRREGGFRQRRWWRAQRTVAASIAVRFYYHQESGEERVMIRSLLVIQVMIVVGAADSYSGRRRNRIRGWLLVPGTAKLVGRVLLLTECCLLLAPHRLY